MSINLNFHGNLNIGGGLPGFGAELGLGSELGCGGAGRNSFREHALEHHHHHHEGCGDKGGQGGEGDRCEEGGYGEGSGVSQGAGCGNNGFDPRFPGNLGNFGGGECGGSSGGDRCGNEGGYGQQPLQVNGNTVNDGQYTIQASAANAGTLTVTDNKTGKSFQVWGDPHITTANGGTADFQQAPATFNLPDGTKITVNPTDNPGVNTINNVTITKGDDAVTMNGFTTGNITTQNQPGGGYRADARTPDGTDIYVARSGDMILPDGTVINNNAEGNIDKYADYSQVQGQNYDLLSCDRIRPTGY